MMSGILLTESIRATSLIDDQEVWEKGDPSLKIVGSPLNLIGQYMFRNLASSEMF